eukprot:jgi/Bigna1/56650/estExt_Genewise1Plus.C_1100032
MRRLLTRKVTRITTRPSTYLGITIRKLPFPSLETKETRPLSTEASQELRISESCCKRLMELKEKKNEDFRLRVRVDSGGCSGFQYEFVLEPMKAENEEGDSVFEENGATVVVDEASMEFLKGSTIDYEQELIGSKFIVAANPNSESACGCGVSFSPKM